MFFFTYILNEKRHSRDISLYNHVPFSTPRIYLLINSVIWILTEPLKPKEAWRKWPDASSYTWFEGTLLIRKFLSCLPCFFNSIYQDFRHYLAPGANMRKITFTILIKLNAGGKMKQFTESSSSQIFMNYSRTSIEQPLLVMRRLAPP